MPEPNGMSNGSKGTIAPILLRIDPWDVHLGPSDLFPGGEAGPQTEVARGLAALGLPDLRIISAPGALALYSRDQADVPDMLRTTLFDTIPDAVAQPFSVEAVSAVMRYASSKKLPVTVRGAGSWPFGGSMPVKGGIVMDMNAMDRILDFDASTNTVKVQAGARWADLDWYLEKKDLSIRSSPSSRFSTVGGWVATGGIGIGSISGGHLSRSVKELEVVLANGEMRKLVPTDPSFRSIFGSEGRLAVVTSVTLQTRQKASSPAPRLFFFSDHASALAFASYIAAGDGRPMDLTYYSPSKFDGFNQVLGKAYYPLDHGVMATFESESDPALAALKVPKGATPALPHLSHLMWNERFFPMKARRLGPGLMGAEVLAPKENMAKIVARAQQVADNHGLMPMLEVHFMENGDGMLLCYYITDQTRQLKYTMDSFRGLLITSALLEAGAHPYSYGVWNNAFSDHAPREERMAFSRSKKEMDPQGIMNRGKFPRLKGKYGSLPATMFSPGILGSALRLVNRLGPVSSEGVRMISEVNAFDNQVKDDLLLRTADQCAMCGACVGVCPAYLLTKDERVTGRGKLLTARMLDSEVGVTKEHAHRTFLCMRCKACEQVCQSKLSLIPAYEELERRLAEKHGRNDEEIKRFVEMAEDSPAYDALVDRGLVLGSATKELEGGK
jgi:FAD/FMN-containing dehydrogenase/NAD-dependent dihydropyrimidine dehydrogenase PreA subunit